ncbi:MAG: hypothetical protein KDA79_11855 [Planctomycetaceae bacterium]|nr:hypothetical protein [Planctomycetaceae bacterium]
MATSFAGSKHLDGRRRRRLASEHTDPNEAEAADTADSREERQHGRDCAVQQRLRHFPVRKVISRRPWKAAVLSTFVLGTAAGLIAAAWFAGVQPELFGPAIARMFQLPQPQAMQVSETVLVLLAGQLCLLIWWARSRSLQDFSGSYHFWLSAAATCFCISLCTALGLHTAVVETMYNRQLLPMMQQVTRADQLLLTWLVPSALVVLTVGRGMAREMRGNWVGLLLLRCSVLLAMLWVGGQLEMVRKELIALQEHATVQSQPALQSSLTGILAHLPLITASAGLLAASFLFLSTMLHTRHVIFESVNPPQQKPSLIGRLFRRLTGRGASRSTAGKGQQAADSVSPAEGEESQGRKTAAATAEAEADNSSSTTATRSRRASTRSSAPAVKEESAPARSAKTAAEPEPASQADSSEEDEADKQPMSLKASRALDADRQQQLKGLPKREQRKLRKQWRDEDRDSEYRRSA